MARAGALLAVVLLAATGCASVRVPRCPAEGGPEWRELVTEHFVIRTDLPSKRAAKLAGRLERMRTAVAASLGVDPVQPGRVEVIAFRTTPEFRAFAPRHSAGYYLRYAGGPPRIVLSARVGVQQRAMLAHELTHHFLASAFWRQPRWLSEGLAVYMESLGEDDPADGSVRLGGLTAARYARARMGLVPVREVLAWEQDPGRRKAVEFYASSWALVHWLVHRRPAALADLQRRLASGEEPMSAWRAAMPDYPPEGTALEALDLLLEEYVRSQIVRQVKDIPVPLAIGYFEQSMDSPEVHALRLTIWNHGPDRGHAVLAAEVEEALAEAPDHPIPLQMKALVLKEGDPEPMARRSVEAYPADPRSWVFLGLALPPGDERTNAFRKAVEYSPENPAALHHLATDLLDRGMSGEALPWARKAARLAPWSAPLLATYAQALSELGWCGQAVPHQLRAIEALPESTPPADRAGYVARLAEYRRQCRSGVQEQPVADGQRASGR